MKLLASSSTKEGIINLINSYYYSKTCSVDFKTGVVSNAKGVVSGIKVVKQKGRYKLIADWQ